MPPKSFKPTRERKQRRLVKSHSENDPNVNTDGSLVEAADAPFNTNVEIMIPLTAAQKADKRRLQLKEELKAGLPKMSAKKAKRFNKYIESKLKKEEAVAIMEKLAETKVDTSLFTSTRSIGASRESKKQAIKRALLEEQAGINMEANKQILYEERRVVGMEDYKGEMQDKIMTDQPAKIESVSWAQARTIAEPAANPFAIGATFGTGLKRPLDGEDGPPVIKRIKKNRKPRKVPVIVSDSEHSSDEEMPTSDEESEEGGSGDEGGSDEEEWGGISEDEDAEGSDDSEGSDGSGSSEDESEEEPVERVKPGQSGKANAFKEWALAQRRATDGETGVIKSNIEASMELKSTIVHIPRSREEDMMPLPEELVVVNTDRKVTHANALPTDFHG